MWPIRAEWLQRGLRRDATVAAVADDVPAAARWSCDLFDHTLRWDDGVYDLFGIDRGMRVDRRETLGFYEYDSRVAMERLRAAAIAVGGSFTLDARIVGGDGTPRWMRLDAQVSWQRGRRLIHGTKRDVTANRVALDALRRQVEHDSLTGLAGRFAFERRWARETVTLVDVAVASVRGRYGREAADACLVAVAERLRAAFPDAAMIARVDDARFAVLGAAVGGAALARLSLPVVWDGRLVHFGVSVVRDAHPDLSPALPFPTGEGSEPYRSLR